MDKNYCSQQIYIFKSEEELCSSFTIRIDDFTMLLEIELFLNSFHQG